MGLFARLARLAHLKARGRLSLGRYAVHFKKWRTLAWAAFAANILFLASLWSMGPTLMASSAIAFFTEAMPRLLFTTLWSFTCSGHTQRVSTTLATSTLSFWGFN